MMVEKITPSMGGKNKRKGGAYERKVAAELSLWMFSDKDVLKRHPSSGADKCIWTGDIVPLKQLPTSWNKFFPFMIETKIGYELDKPTFWKHTRVLNWFIKAYNEGLLHKQHNIFLICQFKSMQPLLFTNILLDNTLIDMVLTLPIKLTNGSYLWVYTYLYKDMLNIEFAKLFDINDNKD